MPVHIASDPLRAGRAGVCLLVALHVVDGYTDPWLAPSEELFIDPALAGSAPATTPSAAPKPMPVVSRIAFKRAHLAAVAPRGLALSMRCATACKGKVKVEVAAATAEQVHLAKGALALTRAASRQPPARRRRST